MIVEVVVLDIRGNDRLPVNAIICKELSLKSVPTSDIDGRNFADGYLCH